jgi:hypothetical protein
MDWCDAMVAEMQVRRFGSLIHLSGSTTSVASYPPDRSVARGLGLGSDCHRGRHPVRGAPRVFCERSLIGRMEDPSGY